MKPGYSEAIQIGLSAKEISVALQAFELFNEALRSDDFRYTSYMNSWRSIKQNSDKNFDTYLYWVIRRGSTGNTLEMIDPIYGKNLYFRQQRIKNKRVFCVQRKDTIFCVKCKCLYSVCPCKLEGFMHTDAKSILTEDHLHVLKERHNLKYKVLGDK